MAKRYANLISVGQTPVGQMSVDQIFFDQKTEARQNCSDAFPSF
jgi:hypothetical protein